MKKIIKILLEFVKEDFNPASYFITITFLATGIYFNYVFDAKEFFVDQHYKTLLHWPTFMFYIGLPYFFALLVHLYFKGEFPRIKDKDFWIMMILALIILTINGVSKNHIGSFIKLFKPHFALYSWLFYVGSSIQRLIVLGLPLIVFKYFYDKEMPNIYGLTLKNFDAKPYLFMLAMMIPLITWASFQPDFLRTYPIYKPDVAENIYKMPHYITVGVFETTYALRFITVELFFRGFLVVGLMRVLGPRAVLPMAAMYCFWHFGKPAAETISSFFGGYILGIIALRTRTIFGGVLIHMGIALLMELAAYIQIYK